jgi:hypothetical protein
VLKTLVLIGLIAMAWHYTKHHKKEKIFNPFHEIWKGLTGTEF